MIREKSNNNNNQINNNNNNNHDIQIHNNYDNKSNYGDNNNNNNNDIRDRNITKNGKRINIRNYPQNNSSSNYQSNQSGKVEKKIDRYQEKKNESSVDVKILKNMKPHWDDNKKIVYDDDNIGVTSHTSRGNSMTGTGMGTAVEGMGLFVRSKLSSS